MSHLSIKLAALSLLGLAMSFAQAEAAPVSLSHALNEAGPSTVTPVYYGYRYGYHAYRWHYHPYAYAYPYYGYGYSYHPRYRYYGYNWRY